ncbi:MAG: selenium cofactor biosynthesis protein YqeC [Rhodocyclaceae bacterium]|nr:selenium cofactor biosynthesis protein YqeC [Rhodocyclaceae bacterium]
MSACIQPLECIFPAASRGILSLVGAGGKTSLMFHLARLLCGTGQTVLTTTTTKIYVPTPTQSETVLVANDPQAILLQAAALTDKLSHVTAGAAVMDAEEGKLKGFAPEAIDKFAESGLFDWILVEADGAARHPLKAPAAHEPVIPVSSNIVIAVAGLDALARPLSEVGVFRAELAAARMGLKVGESITESALCRLISHPLGLFKGAPDRALRVLFLNKADTQERREAAARIAAELEQHPFPVADVLLIGQALETLIVHARVPIEGRH